MKVPRRIFLIGMMLLGITVAASGAVGTQAADPYHHEGTVAQDGTWSAELTYSGQSFATGDQLTIDTILEIDSIGLAYNLEKTRGLYCLVTGRRLFDGSGQYIGDAGALFSTRLDLLGMPIEAEEYRVPHVIFGSDRISPVTSYVTIPPEQLQINKTTGQIKVSFKNIIPVDEDIPAGYYKIRLDFGIEVSPTMRITLAGTDPASIDAYHPDQTFANSRLIDINTSAPPRMIWSLFSQFHPGGGALPLEDKGLGALSRRRGSYDYCLLPLKDQFGRQVRYLLEPDFPGELNPFLNRDTATIGLDYKRGWLSLRIKNPDGTIIDCGSSPFLGPRGMGATTGSEAFFFSFSQYGKHLVECKGWITDEFGTVYQGGGVYEIWVAQPIIIDPGTPPGMPVAIGELYNTSVHLYPPLPAEIGITQYLNRRALEKIDSDYHKVHANRFGQFVPDAGQARSRATRSGIVRFNETGFYRILYTAEYREKDGTLWMGQLESFGVVYDPAITTDAGGTKAPESVLPFPQQNKTSNKAFRIDYPLRTSEIIFLPEDNFSFFDPLLIFKPALFGEIFRGDEDVLVSIGDLFGLRTGTGARLSSISYYEDINREAFQYFSAVRSDKISQMAISEVSPDSVTHPHSNPFNAGELPRDETGDYFILCGGLHFTDPQVETHLNLPYVSSAFVTRDYANPVYYAAGEVEISDQLFPRKLFTGFHALYPGDILRKGDAYVIDAIALPNLPADYEIVISKPNGEVVRAHGSSDRYGFIGDPDQWFDLDEPGVYRVSYIIYRGDQTGYPLGTSEDTEGSFNTYVIDGGYDNRIDFRLEGRTGILANQPFTLRGDVTGSDIIGGRANVSVSFQGSLVEELTIDITDGQFAYNLNPASITGLLSNYSANDPNDRLDITFFVMGITSGGKVRYAAERLYTYGQYLYVTPMEYDDIKAEDRRSRVEREEQEEKGKEYRRNRGLRG